MKVYVSGRGIISSLGNSSKELFSSLMESKSAVRKIPAWDSMNGLNCRLGAPAQPYNNMTLPRVARRTMSPMSEMAALASEQALEQAGLKVAALDFSRALLVMGSTTGSPIGLEEYFRKLMQNNGVQGQSGTAFFKVMNHSVASNVAVALGFNGAVQAPSSACATSAQSVIMGWEMIKSGLYDIAICGGADELHYLSAAVFDSVYAASRGYHDSPSSTPRPFDRKRDGLIVSEGAGIVILESERHLEKRGGKALAEFCGGAYMCESSHMSQSNENQMTNVMNLALQKSGVQRDDIQYVNAHATGTLQGDAAEAMAIKNTFGGQVPVSSLKGHLGHSMAACGTIELDACINMMDSGLLIGTHNLEEVAPECAGVMHLQGNHKIKTDIVLSNNFAFGGINTSFILKTI